MMHGPGLSGNSGTRTGWDDPPFARIGTIDPGDIVFVKDIDAAEDIEPAFGAGDRHGYGGAGDVLVYRPNGRGDVTAIIHRAMLYVEAVPEACEPQVDCVFRIPSTCDNPSFADWAEEPDFEKYCLGSPDLITLHLRRDGLFLNLDRFPCNFVGGCPRFSSGFVTKGDNNLGDDQQSSGISRTVQVPWIIGKARGEVPWFGLIKLAIYGNPNYRTDTDPTEGANWKILRARAPWDIWTGLFLALGALVSVPVVVDAGGNFLARRRERPPGPGRPPPKP